MARSPSGTASVQTRRVEAASQEPVPPATRRERLIRVVAAISLAFSTFYIVWRWGWTLNPDALWFSIPLAVAETYGLITAVFLTVTAWSLKTRTPARAPRGKSVDVFVTCYNEPLTVIRKTVLAAREINYPHKTWILDDGKREEIRTLAKDLGVSYLRREGNEHAKAGNLNHALKHSQGEFILQLDADHVPLPQIIDRLLGFFADERVAFAQSPQDFYNTDGFTYDVNQRARRIWEDQQLFFRVLQPGKDRLGAAFFVGSCAIIRRNALNEIGGFATHSITEDIETSLLLHSRGWKSVYLNETLAYGLAPASATAFHVQHLRWGQGAMQVLRRYHPLTRPGLTLAQRLCYFDSLSTYLGGFQRLILYLAPITFFVTGAWPLRAPATSFAAIFLPYLALQLISFKLLARGHGSLLLADRYSMAKFFTHILALTGYARRRLRFRVTPKGASDVPFRTYAPQLTLILLTFGSIAWAVAAELRADPYEVPGWGALAFWVNLGFALWNAAVAAFIVRMSLRILQKRSDHRFAESLPITVRVLRPDGKLAALDVAVSENLNPYGVALRGMHPLEKDARVELTLPLSTGDVQVNGHVVHQRSSITDYGEVHVHGVEFDELEWAARDAIELHCSHHATPLHRQRYGEGGSTIAGTLKRFRRERKERRVPVGMPARVTTFDTAGNEREIGFALLEDVSPRGARILLDHPIAPNSSVRLEIPNSKVVTEGRTVFVEALETSVGSRFIVGLQTAPTPETVVVGPQRRWLHYVTAAATRYQASVRGAVNAGYRAVAGQTRRWWTAARPPGTRPAAPATTPLEARTRLVPPPVPSREVLPAVPREVFAVSAQRTPELQTIAPAPRFQRAMADAMAIDALPVQIDADPGDHDERVEETPEPVHSSPVPVPVTAARTVEPILSRGAEIMERPEFSPQPSVQDFANLMAIGGKAARIHGKIEVADSIQVECEHIGEILCGGKLTIGASGKVTGDIQTVDAVIRGRYSGNLVASGTVEVAAGARVTGTVDAPELAIAKGAFFKGTILRPDDEEDIPSEPVAIIAPPRSSRSTPEPALSSGAIGSRTAGNGQTTPSVQEVVVLSADAFPPSQPVTP